MPYIEQAVREAMKVAPPCTEGELNYLITKLLNEYISRQGKSYKTINALVGVLECAKLELYRRIAAPYEDKKKESNGDVYTV